MLHRPGKRVLGILSVKGLPSVCFRGQRCAELRTCFGKFVLVSKRYVLRFMPFEMFIIADMNLGRLQAGVASCMVSRLVVHVTCLALFGFFNRDCALQQAADFLEHIALV